MSIVEDLTHRLQVAASLDRSMYAAQGQPALSPQAMWLLLGLVQHKPRQAEALAVALQHFEKHPLPEGWEEPNRPAYVAGDINRWELDGDEVSVSVTNKSTNEIFNFYSEFTRDEWFIERFYYAYLRSNVAWDFVERRIIELHPSIETLTFAFDELVEQRLAVRPFGVDGVQLVPQVFHWNGFIDVVNDLCHKSEGRVHVGMALGDWALVGEDPTREL